MKESLEKINQDFIFISDELRQALNKSNNIESLFLLSFIKKTIELKTEIETFSKAYVADNNQSE